MIIKITDFLYRPFRDYHDKKEKLVYFLIFLFPIAGMSVRHWISNIFIILVLIGLFYLRKPRKPRKPLGKQERIFLWICAAYFIIFLLSAFLNGWGRPQTHYLGTELRYLFVIPIYLLIRNYDDCTKWLTIGAIFGGFFLFGQACYDVYILNIGHANGVYSKNIIGPFSVLVAFWIIYFAWTHRENLSLPFFYLLAAAVIGAILTAGMSGSRGSYVGFMVTALFCSVFFIKPRWVLVAISSTIITGVVLYKNLETVKRGVDEAVTQFVDYYKAEDHVTSESSSTSVGVRLEMYRSSWLVFQDNPLLGTGPGNYITSVQKYIDTGQIHPAVGLYPNPHNVFLEVSTAKGILGLTALLLLLYYPAYIFIKDYKTNKETAIIGLIHIIAITSFALTDHSVIVKNNYVSIFLLGMAIFLSSHIRKRTLAHD